MRCSEGHRVLCTTHAQHGLGDDDFFPTMVRQSTGWFPRRLCAHGGPRKRVGRHHAGHCPSAAGFRGDVSLAVAPTRSGPGSRCREMHAQARESNTSNTCHQGDNHNSTHLEVHSTGRIIHSGPSRIRLSACAIMPSLCGLGGSSGGSKLVSHLAVTTHIHGMAGV